jgi:hypothetical protein
VAGVYGLALDARDAALATPVYIRIAVCDETTPVVSTGRIFRRFRRAGNRCFVHPVGVQTNRFLRALDIARWSRLTSRWRFGGFHVRGLITMLPELIPELREAIDMGVMLFAGGGLFRAPRPAPGVLVKVLRQEYERAQNDSRRPDFQDSIHLEGRSWD